jgi:hypothetical protein
MLSVFLLPRPSYPFLENGAGIKYHPMSLPSTLLKIASMSSPPAGTSTAKRSWRPRKRASRSPAKADDLELKGEGRFGKQDFRYVAEEDVYILSCR